MPLVLLNIGNIGSSTDQGFSYIFEISCSAEKMQTTHYNACKMIGLDWNKICNTPYMLNQYDMVTPRRIDLQQAESLVKTGLVMTKNSYSGSFTMSKKIVDDFKLDLNILEIYMHLVTWQAKNEGWEFNFWYPGHAVVDIGGDGFSECPQCACKY